MRNNPTANHLRPFLYNHIKMDLDLVNASLKELGERNLKTIILKKLPNSRKKYVKNYLS